MAEVYTQPWHYDGSSGAGGRANISSPIARSGTYEIEWHFTSTPDGMGQYIAGEYEGNAGNAFSYTRSLNRVTYDDIHFTGAPPSAYSENIRVIVSYDSANVGAEMSAKIDINDGNGLVDLGTKAAAGYNINLKYLCVFKRDAKHSRLIIRDAPNGIVLHDFNANKVKLNAGGYGERGDADAVVGSEYTMYDVVGGLEAASQTSAANSFTSFNNISHVNNGNPISIGSTGVQLEMAVASTVTDILIDDGTNQYYPDFVSDGSTITTFDVPLTSNTTMVDLGTHTMTVTLDDASTFSTSVTISAPTGHELRTLVDPVVYDESSYSYGASFTPAIGDHYFWVTTTDFDITVNNVIELYGDAPWSHTVWHLSGAGLRETTAESGYGNNIGPTVVIAAGSSIAEGSTGTLDASSSTDDGSIVSYLWEQISPVSPVASIADTSAASTTFTAPSVDADTVFTFKATLTDNDSNVSSDTVDFTVTNISPSVTVVVNADDTITEDDTGTLSSSGSSATNGSIVSYLWEQTSPTSPTATIVDATAADTTFTVPNLSADTVFIFRVTLTDNEGGTYSDNVRYTVNNNPPVVSLVVNAGDTVNEHMQGTLDASGTTVTNGSIVSYLWEQTSPVSPVATIADTSAANTTFMAPEVTEDTSFVFQVTVTDSDGFEYTDTVTHIVTNVVPTFTPSNIFYGDDWDTSVTPWVFVG